MARAFIGVPILIAFMVYSAQAPSSHRLAALPPAGTAVKTDGCPDLPAP